MGVVEPRVQTNGYARKSRIDAWFVLDLLVRRWHWLVLGSCISASCFYLLGWYLIRPKFTATAQLIRYEAVGKSDYFKTTPVSGDTFAALIRAPELLQTVGSRLFPPVPAETFNKWIKVDPDPDSDVVKVYLAARDPQHAVDWLNAYVTNAVDYLRQQEAKQLQFVANNLLKRDVKDINQEVQDVENQFLGLSTGHGSTGQITQVNTRLTLVDQRLQKALSELHDLQTKFTDIHPKVEAQQQIVNEILKEKTQAGTNRDLAAAPMLSATSGAGEPLNPQWDVLRTRLVALETGRLDLLNRQREAELYAANPPGSVRVLSLATLADVKKNLRVVKITIGTIFGAGCGFIGAFF